MERTRGRMDGGKQNNFVEISLANESPCTIEGESPLDRVSLDKYFCLTSDKRS